MLLRIVALACAATALASAAPRPLPLSQAASQTVAQSVAAPSAAAVEAARQAQQAKLHYVEIGPSLKGDYKFGYDTGSGPAGQSFREETRLDDGTVKGAYGYIDANGKQRIVKYTAGKGGFVVEGDQEAPGQAAALAASAPHRPQPVAAPQPEPRAQPAAFDEPIQIARTGAQQGQQVNAEQQHTQQLRQHSLAQQQQQLAAQQAALQQQQQAPAAPQHPQLRAPLQPQPQFAPQPPAHQVHDPQNGHYFSSSNDANIHQLLQNQLRHLQQGAEFASAQPPQAQPQQLAPQHFAASSPQQLDFAHQLRARQVAAQQQQPAPAPVQPQLQPQPLASPHAALLALHQQQQHDAQLLANLRAQQLGQLQLQQQHQPAPTGAQAQAEQQAGLEAAPVRPSFGAIQATQASPVLQQQQAQFAAGPVAQASPAAAAAATQAQPEVFGPPVIDIRTLNYSIGQQTRVN